MGDAQASVVEAAQSVVMLAAVGDDAFDREALKRLRAAADLLVSLLLMADPGAKPATVDWELFLSRLGHKEPRPADAPSSAGDLRAAIREFLQASTHKYFTPQLVFEALRDAADFDHTGYPDFRKAVQNAISAMAKSNNPTKLRKVSRGNYIVPGREDMPHPDDDLFGVTLDAPESSGGHKAAGPGGPASGGPPPTMEDADDRVTRPPFGANRTAAA
ncbi:hypothetical protein LVX13_18995 [Streptomyces albulus]|uniref:hypothetical protein n=1 Tax=Streptomyces TaxID=1883 RepID=UPI001F235160|nr:hypothetical protein [Streptomyces noursei]MCE4945185.1 hypothetical protein [Streptomyces noursei]